MDPCRRCSGWMVREWDDLTRSMFLKCVCCGDRPLQVTYRADGLPVGAPMICKQCRMNPRAKRWNVRAKQWDEIEKCDQCANRDRRRQEKYNKKRWSKRRIQAA